MSARAESAGVVDVVDMIRSAGEAGEPEAVVAAEPEAAAVSGMPPEPLYRPLPDPEPYPTDALGEILGAAARAIEERTQAAPAVCGSAVLASAALAVQAHADVLLPTGQARPVSLYIISVVGSGERKSSADLLAGAARREWEMDAMRRYETAIEEHRRRKVVWDREHRRIERDGKATPATTGAALDALGRAPVPPPLPLLTCPEPTYEGLVRQLRDGLPSIGIFADEGGQFVGGHGMHEDARLRTATGLSAAWDGEPIRRVRGGDGVVVLRGRRVSLHIMAQPMVAARLLADPELIDQGLLSRTLVCAPAPRAGTRSWRETSTAAESALTLYDARLTDLHNAPLPYHAGGERELAPRRLPLSERARRRWIAYYEAVEAQAGEGGELHAVTGLAGKMPEHAARIAAALTLVEDLDADAIDEDRMAAGIEIAQHHLSEALRLYHAGRLSEGLTDAERVLRWLRDGYDRDDEYLSLPDVYRYGPGRVRTAAAALAVVGILTDHGYLHELTAEERDLMGGTVAGIPRRRIWRILHREPPR